MENKNMHRSSKKINKAVMISVTKFGEISTLAHH